MQFGRFAIIFALLLSVCVPPAEQASFAQEPAASQAPQRKTSTP